MEIEQQLLNPAQQGLLAIMVLIIMFGMGAALTPQDFRNALYRPRGMLIGFLSQFGLMPLIAFSLAHLLQLSPAKAIALILIGCLPGGSTSNMFTYFARGSVALSISMTAASTVLALIMMPLLLELYASGFAAQLDEQMRKGGEEGHFVIPYSNIVSSLLVVIVPVAAGMVLRRFSPDWAKTAEDTAGFMAIIVILFLLFSALLLRTEYFLATPWEIYVASICIGLAGFLFGYGTATAFRMPPRFKRSISLETGIQNGPIAFAIILLSFSEPIQSEMLWIAILYSAFIVVTSSFVTLFYRRIGKVDWELHQNTRVHKRLFGEDYQTRYPRKVVGDVDTTY
ncbi:bile acid:sodium symporter [Halorhodospira halochloris]|uniref:bile acid:sodium symporter family protein n=1 Tax=Halorhodospira halochloris TaxID=1052 RepID=UPI001EE9442D|nr:bile acid:sodium symporter [Halorhodospira halochloris]MCG5530656.1 bile acid:sodium symporter [Halorhodospira halochloris]MCG5548720.1 bile acid:sodium symporter [Halorhodospira halochloris]